MASLRTARRALADMLAAGTSTQVVPHPPRQNTTGKMIFFGAMSGNRETQDGAEEATIPVLVCVPSTDDSLYDVLDEYVDGPTSVVDLIDSNPELGGGVSVAVAGEWRIESVEVGATVLVAAVFDVSVRWS